MQVRSKLNFETGAASGKYALAAFANIAGELNWRAEEVYAHYKHPGDFKRNSRQYHNDIHEQGHLDISRHDFVRQGMAEDEAILPHVKRREEILEKIRDLKTPTAPGYLTGLIEALAKATNAANREEVASVKWSHGEGSSYNVLSLRAESVNRPGQTLELALTIDDDGVIHQGEMKHFEAKDEIEKRFLNESGIIDAWGASRNEAQMEKSYDTTDAFMPSARDESRKWRAQRNELSRHAMEAENGAGDREHVGLTKRLQMENPVFNRRAKDLARKVKRDPMNRDEEEELSGNAR